MDNVYKAYSLAESAHVDDKWGDAPYMVHLYLVVIELMKLGKHNDTNMHCAAILHDVIEDHPEYSDTVKADFPEVFESLLVVSRLKDETYTEFIDRIICSGNHVAITVKYCDMLVNLMNNPPDRLRKRYEQHIGRLADAYENVS